MDNAKKVTAAALRQAVLKLFLEEAIAAEEALQGRGLTKNERIAFKCGLYRGVNFDLVRDGNWDRAAQALQFGEAK